MRRRLFALLLVATALAASATAATDPLQTRAKEVRNAIPAAFAYYADHNTYAGMTLAKLRRYDRSIRNVAVRRATKSRFCIQSTYRPFVHYAGPAGPVRKGACGVNGAEVPRVDSGSPAPPITTAEQRLRAAVPAIEAYAADHGSYAGMTLDQLRRYDYGISDVRIAWTTRDRYCIESGSGAETYHRLGPAEGSKPGPVRRRPSPRPADAARPARATHGRP
jgi:hypothetical protein